MGRIALILMLLCTGLAVAQNKPEGTRLFDEGRELAKQGRYEEACEKFSKSLQLDRAPGTALNYGDCLEKLGQLRKAWQAFDEAARAFGKTTDSRAGYARERANAVEGKLAVVVVKVADPEVAELVIRIGTESVPPAGEIVARVEPGEIEVAASAPAREPFSQSARGVAGQRVIVEVPALPVSGGKLVDDPRSPPERRDPKRVKLAIITGGVGGAALIGALAFSLVARGQYNSAVDDECMIDGDDLVCTQAGADEVYSATRKANIATGLAIGGGALLAAGVVLYVTAPKERAIMPTVSTTSVGLAFSGRF
jgi:tetratricopeptide (TPR) repeat protein